jgi:hypothetical protein
MTDFLPYGSQCRTLHTILVGEEAVVAQRRGMEKVLERERERRRIG